MLIQSAGINLAQRADMIYAHARVEADDRLWRAALDSDGRNDGAAPISDGTSNNFDMLLTALGHYQPAESTAPRAPSNAPPLPAGNLVTTALDGLGLNDIHRMTINAAAARTGVPASAIAAIIDAEAAKNGDGSWKVYSHNPRSTAKGLGQFLVKTWEGEAQRAGTWLNNEARLRGWLDTAGKVTAGARSALLALRYDAHAAINATADYASSTLAHLRKAGVEVGESAEKIARTAYIGHNLGIGDAIRFLGHGLDSARARTLLNAQVGQASAERQIAQAGGAADAHRAWLLQYVDRHVNPGSFSG